MHRLEACPTGEHVDPQTEQTVDCTCPALVVKASGPPGPTEPHLMQWTRGELQRLVREFDRGYFDHEGAPARTTSMFISDWQQQLLDAVRDDPLRAVTMLLARMRFDMLSFDPQQRILSFRAMPGKYLHLMLPKDQDATFEVRRMGTPAGDELWSRPQLAGLDPQVEEDVRGQIRGLLKPRGWSPADTSIAPLVDDTVAEDATLEQLEAFAEQLPMRELLGQMGINEALVMGAADMAAAQMTEELRAAGILPEGAEVVYDKTPLTPAGDPPPAPPVRARKSKRKPGSAAPKMNGGGAPVP